MVRIRRTLAIIAMLIMAISANAWPWLSPSGTGDSPLYHCNIYVANN